MEKQEFGFYVVHFFDQTYGIVNLDYIFEIEAVKNKGIFGVNRFEIL